MMRSFFPLVFATAAILILGLVEILLLRFFNPAWWRIRWIRRLGLALPLLGTLFIGLWGIGEYYTHSWLAGPAAAFAAVTFVLLVGLMLSLPLSGLVHFVHWLVDRIRSRVAPTDEPPDSRRRLVFKAVAAAVPVITIGAGVGGVARAFAGVTMPLREIVIDDLPVSLQGLRILQLSDLHLRHYVTLDDLAIVLEQAERLRPDLILVTGDIADELSMLPDAVRMINDFHAPLGAYAALGNHEYFRGVAAVRQIFDHSPVPLLVDQGVRIPVNGRSLYVAAIDDPRRMGAKEYSFYQRTVDAAIRDATSEDTIVLMSHRPDAFDYTARMGVHLTLSGHTHGGQIGFMGRSAFETVWPDRYLWGHYARNGSQLYTTAGMGHWFPFRLGCPQEAPVIELRRG